MGVDALQHKLQDSLRLFRPRLPKTEKPFQGSPSERKDVASSNLCSRPVPSSPHLANSELT